MTIQYCKLKALVLRCIYKKLPKCIGHLDCSTKMEWQNGILEWPFKARILMVLQDFTYLVGYVAMLSANN